MSNTERIDAAKLAEQLSRFVAFVQQVDGQSEFISFRDRDSGHALENVVYFELLRRGYDVAIGKVDNTETELIATEDIRHRELAPLQKIS